MGPIQVWRVSWRLLLLLVVISLGTRCHNWMRIPQTQESATVEGCENTVSSKGHCEEKHTESSYLSVDMSDRSSSEVFLDDLSYRRVCERISEKTTLCLVLRFPFQLPLQDPSTTYPHPFEERMYNVTSLELLDGLELAPCLQLTGYSSPEELVKACLEQRRSDSETEWLVEAVWTRTRTWANGSTTTELYQTGTEEQYKNLLQFFHGNHTVVYLGASPTPSIKNCILTLFSRCVRATYQVSFCNRRRWLQEQASVRHIHYPFQPVDIKENRVTYNHSLPEANVTALLKGNGLAPTNDWKPGDPLQPLTIVVDYPIAHAQKQWLILNHWDQVVNLQEGLAQMILDVRSTQGVQELASLGFSLERLIAFDGLPQFFPTETGAYMQEIARTHNEQDFIADPYPGWHPEMGTRCRGPLPGTSPLAAVNQVAREFFLKNQHDSQTDFYYGRTWEFANQLWFMRVDWRDGRIKALDCTHAKSSASPHFMDQLHTYYCVHKYVLQAMIDDYFE